MKNYYVYEDKNKIALDIPQDEQQKLACEIVSATIYFGEISNDLIAIDAKTANTSYYLLKGIALYSIELTQDGINLWGDHGRTINSYLLGSLDNQSDIWHAFNRFESVLNEFESICNETSVFEDIGVNISGIMESFLDEYLGRDQYQFTCIVEEYYKIQELKNTVNL
jgi:hypothetical protein